MTITFDDCKKQEWLYKCLMSSLTKEAMDSGMATRSFEVKLLVNHIELEPKTLDDLLSNIEKHIDNEAQILSERKLVSSNKHIDALNDIIIEAQEKIADLFNLEKPANNE